MKRPARKRLGDLHDVGPFYPARRKKRNSKTIIKAKRVTILNLKKNPAFAIHKTLKPAKRGNQSGWLLGTKFIAKSRGQKALPGGSVLDLNSGLVYQRVENPKRRKNVQMMGGGGAYPIRASADYDPVLAGESPSRKSSAAQKAKRRTTQKKIKAAGGVKRYVSKIKTRKAATRKARSTRSMTAATKQRKATTTRLASRSLDRSGPSRKTKRNSGVTEKLQEWRGYPKDRDDNLRFPNGTPAGLYRLGALKKIVTTHNTINFASNQAWLCADTKGKLYVGGIAKSAAKGRMTNVPSGSLGKVTRVEYLEKKPHLKDYDKTLYFHKMGEEDGNKPTLYSDGDGNLLFKGGNYQVTYRGIVN